MQRFRNSFFQDTDALPLDIFRILVGVLSLGYFLRTLCEAPYFSGPDGLIDHQLSVRIFGFTSGQPFGPQTTLPIFQITFVIASIASCSLILGYRVKFAAAIAYVIAVFTYRWNFLVMYVDDSIMHLMLWWILLLPVGRTLVLGDWLANREQAWRRWKEEKVPGANLRLFLCNLALLYLVAGLWKWTSPMWREGTALYAVLKLPISRTPDFWGPQHLALLKIATWLGLILESLFAFIVVLPKRSAVKYALVAGLLSFHLGIISTVGLPVANFACLAALVLLLRDELMEWIRRRDRRTFLPARNAEPELSNTVAIAFMVTLTMAMLSSVLVVPWRMPGRVVEVPSGVRTFLGRDGAEDTAMASIQQESRRDEVEGLGTLQRAFFAPLWSIGIAQQYQLFNWIDDRNFHVRLEAPSFVSSAANHEIDLQILFPKSTRSALLQTYLEDITWMKIPDHDRSELKKSILQRLAKSYCRRSRVGGTMEVYSTLERINPKSVQHNEQREFIMQFSCEDTEARIEALNVKR